MKVKVKSLNYPLIFGTAIILFLLIFFIYGEQIVQIDPYAVNLKTDIYENGGMTTVEPDSPPNPINKLGTDILGRDILSRLITGTKITLTLAMLISLFRFLVALPFAFFSGFGGKFSSKVISFFSRAFSAIPALIMSFFILNMSIIRRLELEYSIIAFTIVFTFVGWGRLSKILKDRVEDILKEEFIQGEIAIGKTKFFIAIQNVLPHMAAFIVIQILLEMGRVLLLIAQLSIFEVYVGRNRLDPDMIYSPDTRAPEGFKLLFMPSYEPEWGSMLACSRYAILASKPWLVFYPACAFFIGIIGFNLTGEGLKTEISKRNSRAISIIKRVPYHISPITFVHQLKNYKREKKSLIIKSVVIIVVLVVFLIPPPKSLIEIDSQGVYAHIHELDRIEYGGRITGSEGRDMVVKYITDKLEEYEIEPYFENGFIEELDTDYDTINLVDSELRLLDKDNNIISTFKYKDEYMINKKLIVTDGLKLNEYVDEYELAISVITEEQYKKKSFEKPEDTIMYRTEKGDIVEAEFKFQGKITSFKSQEVKWTYPCYILLDKDTEVTKEYITSLVQKKYVLGVIIEASDFKNLEGFQQYNYAAENLTQYIVDKSKGTIMHFRQLFRNELLSRSFGNTGETDPFIITVDSRIGEKIRENGNIKLALHNKFEVNRGIKFKNIGGIVKGNGSNNDEKIIITTNYDYLGDKSKGFLYNVSSVSAALEIAKKLGDQGEKLDRDIIFMFFDGSRINDFSKEYSTDPTGARMFMMDNFKDSKGYFSIALNNFGLRGSNRLFLDTSRLSTQMKKYYSYVKYIKRRASDLGISLKQDDLVDGTEDVAQLGKFGGQGIMLESINTKQQNVYDKLSQDDIEIIKEKNLEKQIQLVLDTILYISYKKD